MDKQQYNSLQHKLLDLEVIAGDVNDSDTQLKQTLNVLVGSIQVTRHELNRYGVERNWNDNPTEN